MRRQKNLQREIVPDRKYGSPVATKLISYVMRDGKKSIAERIVYAALEEAGKKLEREPSEVLNAAIEHTSPVIEVRSRRVGGATYQVPREVRGERRLQLALRWIVSAARGHKKRHSMAEALAEELLLAAKGEGSAVKRKDDMHKMAEANRAFAHFAW
ncbi:MAG: 30S ribosomal protein S7 [Candidatus Terrybacteria bacterium RIFCSPLOWO2_01_FULL_58_14]|uniref:Small ribosomal subunit protein uS7 n=2 Tax=Candidatus Terryibacteriota TaxID=1817920 RepID=A0A1G2PWS6_9BACT|nr:MAG: 30S ribosomal protein S7 [Candidatus Terrybacteria bacterium RIFCSPHIGHO2_01_FULL_58_15]OHA52775.1 MAG: 30S ribosomal protein S7 [Candidatus Terrybacteria bacterium RIFCSPLOWO2_01_FULL_58_14]